MHLKQKSQNIQSKATFDPIGILQGVQSQAKQLNFVFFLTLDQTLDLPHYVLCIMFDLKASIEGDWRQGLIEIKGKRSMGSDREVDLLADTVSYLERPSLLLG